MRRYFLALLAVIVTLAANAQQWEIECSDINSYTKFNEGIINDSGEAVLIGECGSDNKHYSPMVMRVTQDGEYDYRVFDTLGSNVSPTHIIQQGNGTYLVSAIVQPDDYLFGDIVFMIIDSDLKLVGLKRYDKPEMVLGFRGGRLLLDKDGTVVFSCGYRYLESPYDKKTKPCFYRLNMNADTLSCRFVTASFPHPEESMRAYDCFQILQNPNNDGIVVLGCGIYNITSLLLYGYDFNYEDGFQIMPVYPQNFSIVYSDHWISDNRLLVMGHMWPDEEYSKWAVGMAEVGIDETYGRWTRVYHKQDTAVQSSHHCMAYVNDTTIYGGAFYHGVLSGEIHSSLCLYDTDMELLGRKEFFEPEYGYKSPCGFVLPMPDGCCLASILSYYGETGHYIGRLIKMSREDFNPIPCSVSEVPREQIKASAFPNPVKDVLNIDISGLPADMEHRIQIADISGNICMDRIIKGQGNVLTIEVSSLSSGAYVYTIYNTEKEFARDSFIKE